MKVKPMEALTTDPAQTLPQLESETMGAAALFMGSINLGHDIEYHVIIDKKQKVFPLFP